MELEGHLCLFAGNPDGSFLALPPMGPDPGGPAMTKAFEFLSKRNRTQALTRVENAPEGLAARCREKGYRVAPKGPAFVYRRPHPLPCASDRQNDTSAVCDQCLHH